MSFNSFALNQIILPNKPFEDFINFSKKLNIKSIEIRNDIKTNLIEENDPIKIKNICEENSINILSINALQKFNIWNKDRENELISLCKYADKANINAIVLVPLNDGSISAHEEQIELVEKSLINIIRILEDFKVIGLVEPLGFKQSSLRLKSITINIINSLQSKKLKIVHDTFHHALANEHDFFPSLTGLVHFSGVSNIYNNIELKDDHRSIVENNDIISNLNQMKTLVNSNYKGYFSFEPFSNVLIKNKKIFKTVSNSLNFISSNI